MLFVPEEDVKAILRHCSEDYVRFFMYKSGYLLPNPKNYVDSQGCTQVNDQMVFLTSAQAETCFQTCLCEYGLELEIFSKNEKHQWTLLKRASAGNVEQMDDVFDQQSIWKNPPLVAALLCTINNSHYVQTLFIRFSICAI